MGRRIRLQLRLRTDAEALLRHNPSWTNKARVKTRPRPKQTTNLLQASLTLLLLQGSWQKRQLLQESWTTPFSPETPKWNWPLSPLYCHKTLSPLISTSVRITQVHFSGVKSISYSAPTESPSILCTSTLVQLNPFIMDKVPKNSNKALTTQPPSKPLPVFHLFTLLTLPIFLVSP